jgi:molybdopterin-containing oxidoreductase family iron-sulfur binding subunit
MNRRNFLKALGLGSGVSAVSACGLDDNRYYTPVEQILPYLVRPEAITPGTSTFFATTVKTGPNAYPHTAAHREGRVISMNGNHQAPTVSAIPSSVFLEMQRNYSPDRLKAPKIGGAEKTWEEATQFVADGIQKARADGKRVAWLGGYRTGAFARLLEGITGGNATYWEPLGYGAEVAASKALFGAARLPHYDLSTAHYVLSFGADFLGGWRGPWANASYAQARTSNVGHFVARFALVAAHRDQTGANCDDWYQATPGTQASIALAVAKKVAAIKGYKGPALKLITNADTSASGLTDEQIDEMATRFAQGPSIALPGGVSGTTEVAIATYLLNIVSGAAPERFHMGGYVGDIHTMGDLTALIADMKAGKIGLLMMDDSDPLHNVPKSAGFAEALKAVDRSVVFSGHSSGTSELASAILPVASLLEDWGDEEPIRGMHLLRQPGMTPLYGGRAIGDILLASWRSVAAASAPEGNWRDYLIAHWKENVFPMQKLWDDNGGDQKELSPSVRAALLGQPVPEPNETEAPAVAGSEVEAEAAQTAHDRAFRKWWNKSLQNGFFVSPTHKLREGPTLSAASLTFEDAAVAGAGNYYLQTYRHPFVEDGRFANEPWAQESPCPTTGIVWDSWLEVHPDTAAALGLRNGSKVALTTEHGKVDVGAWISKLIRPDTVALAFGQGQQHGRYAKDVGVNVVDLLTTDVDAHGAQRWQQVKVSISDLQEESGLVTTFGSDDDRDRGFAVAVNAEELSKKGDAPVAHPGELTGIHHLQLDKRLQKAGITGFYPEPDHPTYRFAMTIDADACDGCGACNIACYAENNLPVVGKQKVAEGREMSWLRIDRFFKGNEVHFVPMMCQHCGHAPCESVCPVLATYHNLDGLNAMVYNRCVGTRYCSNACPFGARKFNYHTYVWPEPFNLQLNPDVVTRTMGVMEKCTFCIDKIRKIKSAYRDKGFTKRVPDAALKLLPACAECCPSQAITFGNLNDEESTPFQTRQSQRNHYPIADINVYPAINYLAKASFHVEVPSHGGGHGGGHGDGHGGGHGDGHGGGHGHEKGHGDGQDHDKDHGAHKGKNHNEPASHGADAH